MEMLTLAPRGFFWFLLSEPETEEERGGADD